MLSTALCKFLPRYQYVKIELITDYGSKPDRMAVGYVLMHNNDILCSYHLLSAVLITEPDIELLQLLITCYLPLKDKVVSVWLLLLRNAAH